MKERKLFRVGLILFFVIGPGMIFAAGDRKTVDDYLQSYEAYVVEWENLAKKTTVSPMDLLPLQTKALEFAQKSQAVQADAAWTLQDSTKLLALTQRYTVAAETVNGKLGSL
jgi:hypothetical protein